MAKLYLLRHLKSQWNKDNRFAGWVDNPLSEEGRIKAGIISEVLANERIDAVYTSPLVRNIETVIRVFENFNDKYTLFKHLDGGRMQKWGNFTDLNENNVPTYVSENLNERYYGKLQGLNKDQVIEKYGQDLVRKWRRGYKDRPPGGESLHDTYNRAVPFFRKYIIKSLLQDKNILVVASHNSLRAIVKYLENIKDEDIINLELPFGALITYDFKDNKFTRN